MLHEVDFYKWCPKCEHHKLAENEDPCHECLNVPVNDDSRKPVEFKERTGKEGPDSAKNVRRKVSVSGKPL